MTARECAAYLKELKIVWSPIAIQFQVPFFVGALAEIIPILSEHDADPDKWDHLRGRFGCLVMSLLVLAEEEDTFISFQPSVVFRGAPEEEYGVLLRHTSRIFDKEANMRITVQRIYDTTCGLAIHYGLDLYEDCFIPVMAATMKAHEKNRS